MASIIGSGTRQLQTGGKDWADYAENVAGMLATDQVLLTASAGAAGSFPNGEGPLFVASVYNKGPNTFSMMISALNPQSWAVTIDVDWVVIRH